MPENKNECSFCSLLKDVKARFTNDCDSSECKVALVVEDSCDGNVCRRISYNPRALNFCPVCARKIEKDETIL